MAILLHDNLNETQWPLACTLLDSIIQNISQTIQKTCIASPFSCLPLVLPNKEATLQGSGVLYDRELTKICPNQQRSFLTYDFYRFGHFVTGQPPSPPSRTKL